MKIVYSSLLILLASLLLFLIYLNYQGSKETIETPILRPMAQAEDKHRGVAVLIYHRIVNDDAKADYGNIPYTKFIRQLDYLKSNGYETISFDDLYAYLVADKKIPEKPVVITFDDTNESDYTVAFRELSKRNFGGVFFAIGKRLQKDGWPERVKEMQKVGMEFASHTMSHKYMGGGPDTGGNRIQTVEDKVIQDELTNSKEILETITGKKVYYLAWPGDSYTSHMVELAKEAGYRGIFIAKTGPTTNIMKHPDGVSGFNIYPADPYYIRRITINGADSLENFISTMKDGIYPRPKIND